MIKIIIDTNILIQGMIMGKENASRKILNWALAKDIVILGSNETYKEFCRKIENPKFKNYLKKQLFAPEKLILDYKSIVSMNEPFEVLQGVSISRDPKDDIYLRVAKASGSRVIVTYDEDLLVLKNYDNIIIVKPGDFLKSFQRTRLRKSS